MNRLTILIIEDESIIAADIQDTLEEAGHSVSSIIRNLKQALHSVKNNPPDLAIVDIKLDGSDLDGISIAKELLNHHWMPIIYLTSTSDSDTVKRAKDTTPAAYLMKPFRQQELVIQVELAYHFFKSNTGELARSQRYLYLPLTKGYEKVFPNDVIFLKAQGSYVEIHLLNHDKHHLISMNLGNLAHYFSSPNFYRLSRSLFINLDHLQRLGRTEILMGKQEISLPISETNRKVLMKKLNIVRTTN